MIAQSGGCSRIRLYNGSMETYCDMPQVPCTPRQRRLLRFARRMWSIPLRLATLILLVFLLTDSMALAGLGVIVLVVGGLCAVIGIIAVLVVATQRRQSEVPSDDPYQRSAFRILGLLLSNFAVAGLYAYIGIAQIGTTISHQAGSPAGRYMAEVSYLSEGDTPPYGQAVLLRPADNPFKFLTRTRVFSGYCESVPILKWLDDQKLEVHCTNPTQVAVRTSSYRDVTISYQTTAPVTERPRRKGRL